MVNGEGQSMSFTWRQLITRKGAKKNKAQRNIRSFAPLPFIFFA